MCTTLLRRLRFFFLSEAEQSTLVSSRGVSHQGNTSFFICSLLLRFGAGGLAILRRSAAEQGGLPFSSPLEFHLLMIAILYFVGKISSSKLLYGGGA